MVQFERGDARDELGRFDPALLTEDVVHPEGIATSTEIIKIKNQVPEEPILTGPLFSAALVVLSCTLSVDDDNVCCQGPSWSIWYSLSVAMLVMNSADLTQRY